jgi:predicted glycoside hydrolase/deacetylase ChbG (UPF0249 family)
MSKALNKAILEGYGAGLLKSASLVANGKAFDEALEKVIPNCPDLGVGIHLNVVEGRSLCAEVLTLTDKDGNFNNSYFQLLKKSYYSKKEEFFYELEREFRRQIESIMSKTKVSHIDSHMHIHSIPPIFDLVCRLAKEYGIKEVRTHFEKPYFVPELSRHFKLKYWKNLLRTMVLGLFTVFNEAIIHKYELETNDYLIGLLYDTMTDSLAISYAVDVLKYDGITVEAFIHPSRYEEGLIDNRFDEFLLTKNKKLLEKIKTLGFEITNYVEKKD